MDGDEPWPDGVYPVPEGLDMLHGDAWTPGKPKPVCGVPYDSMALFVYVHVGDWIVKLRDGKFWRCDPKLFEALVDVRDGRMAT